MIYKTLKGTYDRLPEEFRQYEKIEQLFKEFLQLYGYQQMSTPVFEFTGVFQKENDTSDMVTKEMYTFSVNGKDSLTLRPEGTAGIVRSVVENKLYAREELPLKLAYIEEMFRHEHSQRGRQRQFTQLGVENIGYKNPLIDAEVISLGFSFVKALGIKNIRVKVNTLGDSASRIAYATALQDYFTAELDNLCQDCKNRYHKNPLRILDCKIDAEREFVMKAPVLKSYLNEESKKYFSRVLGYLDEIGIPYEVDDKLVRGLDYYTDTVFEIISTNPGSGKQATLFGGGRYDHLIHQMGGPELSGIGFAMGEERLKLALEEEKLLAEEKKKCDIYLLDLSKGNNYIFNIATMLRNEGFSVEINVQERSLKSQFKSFERFGARFGLIVGEDEIVENKLQVKDTLLKTQNTVAKTDLVSFLKERLRGE